MNRLASLALGLALVGPVPLSVPSASSADTGAAACHVVLPALPHASGAVGSARMSSDCRQDAAPACTLHVTVSQGQIAALQTRLASGGLSERERAPLRAGIYDAWLAAARSCWALETRPRCREDYRRNIAAVDAARRCVLDAMQ